MTSTYNPTSLGRTLITGACAIVVGSAFVFGAVAPASASAQTAEMSTARWTQIVEHRLNTSVRPSPGTPDFLLREKVAVVGAHFDADGAFTGVTLERPTGLKSLDREAIRATKSLAYPALPASMRGMPRVVAMRVGFSNAIDPAALARTNDAARQIATKYATTGTEIAAR